MSKKFPIRNKVIPDVTNWGEVGFELPPAGGNANWQSGTMSFLEDYEPMDEKGIVMDDNKSFEDYVTVQDVFSGRVCPHFSYSPVRIYWN